MKVIGKVEASVRRNRRALRLYRPDGLNRKVYELYRGKKLVAVGDSELLLKFMAGILRDGKWCS